METLDLAVTNMYFKKRSTHLATYTSCGHKTQIDCCMVRGRDLKLVTNTKVVTYDSVAPQHRLLVLDIQMDQLHQTACQQQALNELSSGKLSGQLLTRSNGGSYVDTVHGQYSPWGRINHRKDQTRLEIH